MHVHSMHEFLRKSSVNSGQTHSVCSVTIIIWERNPKNENILLTCDINVWRCLQLEATISLIWHYSKRNIYLAARRAIKWENRPPVAQTAQCYCIASSDFEFTIIMITHKKRKAAMCNKVKTLLPLIHYTLTNYTTSVNFSEPLCCNIDSWQFGPLYIAAIYKYVYRKWDFMENLQC